jgi:adhesin/invasin
MVAVFATATAGLVLVQSWRSAEESAAVTYNTSHWNTGGVFSKDELWVVGAGGSPNNYTNPYVIAQPWTATSADFVSRLQAGYNKTGTANGTLGCSGNWENLAMGPVLIGEGDDRIAHLGWNSTGGNGGLVLSGDGNCYSVGDVTPSGGNYNTSWGGEVNQKTGEVYLISDPDRNFDGDSLSNDPEFAIVKVATATSGGDDYTVTRLAASSTTPPAPGAQSLADAATAAGKTGSVTGNWDLGSDMAIDANGNAYRMARFSVAGSAPDYWALIRFNIPRNAQTGAPLSTGWTYNVVKIFDNADVSNVWAMAFLNGALYTGHSSDEVIRWDTLSGANEILGTFDPLLDFAAAQMAPVIEGRIYRDLNGDGQITPGDDTGLGGQVLEVWQQTGQAAPQLRGTLTSDSDGSYSALLPSASDDFYIRLRPTQIGGVNAAQSYTSAGSFQLAGHPANVVTALCFGQDGDYQPVAQSGPCRGARGDGIDPPTVTNPIGATGGANIVAKIDMNSDLAVVTVDFGLTTAQSWGDAPDVYKTSGAAGGPYAAPDSLHLGSAVGHYPDGQPSAAASAHNASDDGLYFAPILNGAVPDPSDWVLAQDQVLAPGARYRFRAEVGGASVAAATAKAWISPLVGGQAATALSDQLLSGLPDAAGYVYGDYTVAAVPPAGGLADVYVRARTAMRSDFTPDSRGSADPATEAWVPRGEIEDYRLAVASGALRIKARTLGGQAAHVNLTLLNIAAAAPSSNAAQLLTKADGSWVRSQAAHAVLDTSAPVQIATAGVGGPSATAMNGWKLTQGGTRCYDSNSGQAVAAGLRGDSVSLTWPSTGADVTCELTYGAAVSATRSSLTATPAPDPANPLTAGVGSYSVKVTGKSLITPAEGQPVEIPAVGEQVALALAPVDGDATATGAHFDVNGSPQTHTCVLDQAGECVVTVQASHRGTYSVTATAEAGTVPVGQANLYFAEGPPAEGKSSATVTQAAGQLANHDAPGSTVAAWGKQTITVTARDALDEPATRLGPALAAAAAGADPFDGEGLYFANGGVFTCFVEPVNGACYTGVYTLDVYSARAGARQIIVTAGLPPDSFELTNGDASPSKILVAPFTNPPASAGDSTLIVSPSVPVDDPDSRDDAPDGVPSVRTAGQSYYALVTAWDAGRNNKIGGVPLAMALTGAQCSATFENGQTTASGQTSDTGVAGIAVTSAKAGTCVLTATITEAETRVPGSPKTLVWQDAGVDPGNANTWFDVSTAEVVANGEASGVITVSLYGANGLPVTTVTDLVAAGPPGGEVSVGSFTHQGEGVYTARFTGTSAGPKLISVRQGTTTILVKAVDGNDTANFINGPGSAEHSWLVQPSNSATANGRDPLTIGARVYDKDGNAVASGTVVFRIDSDLRSGTTDGPAGIEATVTDGWAAIEVVSAKSTAVHGRDYWVTAKIGDAAIETVMDQAEEDELDQDGQVIPVFEPGPPDPDTSVLTVPTAADGATAVADGQARHRVQILVRDADNNPVPNVLIRFDYQVEGQQGYTDEGSWTDIRTGPDGIGHHEWSTLKASTWTIYGILANDEAEVEGSPGTAVFVPGPPVVGPGLTRLEAPTAPAKANGADPQTVKAYVIDGQGNAIKGADVTFTIPSAVRAGGLTGQVTVKTDDQGVARLATTSTIVGAYDITARVGSVELTHGSPAQAVFINADLSLSRSVFAIPTAPAEKVVLTEHHTPKVDLYDVSGNLYQPAVDVTFSYRLAGTANWTAGATRPTLGGTVTWAGFTVPLAGDYEVKAEVAAGQIGAVLTARFKAGPVDLGLTSASFGHTTGKVLNDGQLRHSAWVTVQDSQTNPISGQSVEFTLDPARSAHFVDPVTGADLGKSFPVTSSDVGLARVWLVDDVAETVHLTARIGADLVGQADFQFWPDAPSAADSTWTVEPAAPASRVADGVQRFTATVTVRDASATHLAVPGAEVVFDVPAAVAISEPGPHITGPDGRVQVHFTSLVAGAYEVRALIGANGIEPDPTTINFEVGPISFEPGKTRLRGPGVTAEANGSSPLTVTAIVVDAKDNPVRDAIVEFAVPAQLTAKTPGGDVTGAGGTVVEVAVDPATGIATLDYVTEKADSYGITARAKKGLTGAYGVIADGSPAELVFRHGPVSAIDSIIAKDRPGPLVADGSQSYGVTVTLRDGRGNPFAQAGTSVRIAYQLGAAVIIEELVTDQTGRVSTSFASPDAGPWQATAAVGGEAVAIGSPLPLPFIAGPPDPNVSVFNATRGNVLANGTAAHSAWVVVTDAQGNPVPGQTISFAVAEGAEGVPGPVLTGGAAAATAVSCDPAAAGAPAWCDQAGKALVYVTSDEPGSFAVAAALGGEAVNGSPRDVSFESGPASEAASSYVITPLATRANAVAVAAAGVDGPAYTLTVSARSAADLPVPGAQVRLEGLDPAVTASPAPAGLTGAPSSSSFGAFTWSLTATAAAEFTGRVRVLTPDGWADVGQPFLVRFSATDPVAANSALTIPTAAGGATKVADGAQAHRAEVELRDANRNLVPGAEVVFAWSHPGENGTVVGTATTASGNNGVAVYEFTATRPGAWTIAATVGGAPVTGSPAQASFVSGPPSGATSELVSPAASARGNGEGVQLVKAVLRDALGNPASCWDGDAEVACQVSITLPAGTWTGDGAGRVDGPASVTIEAGLTSSDAPGEAVLEVRGDQGQWPIFGSVAGAPIAAADGIVNYDGQARPALVRFTDAIAPGAPTLDPSDGKHVSGAVAEGDREDAAAGDLTAVVVHPQTGEELGRCAVEADGAFDCRLPDLEHGATIHVRIEDSAANPSDRAEMAVDAISPGSPVPEPSDGSEIGGKGREAGDTIIVRDDQGGDLCQTAVGEDLTWRCELTPPLKEGDRVTIVERDPAGNLTELPWRIGLPQVELATPSLHRGARQTATGRNFQPGETVVGVMGSAPLSLGSATADADGTALFTWLVPDSAEFGAHRVTLTGPLSGAATGSFTVQALPFTGASGTVGLLGSAFGLILAGLLALLAARRRRDRRGSPLTHAPSTVTG